MNICKYTIYTCFFLIEMSRVQNRHTCGNIFRNQGDDKSGSRIHEINALQEKYSSQYLEAWMFCRVQVDLKFRGVFPVSDS